MSDTPAKIMIGSPTPGTVRTPYMKCVIGTLLDLGNRGIPCEFATEEGSVIELQRNVIASRFLRTECTHLFFYDSDMMIPNDLCATLLAANKPLIGAIYTTRYQETPNIERALAAGLPLSEASLFGGNWILHLREGVNEVRIQDGLLQVDMIGMGAALIRREVFEAMVANRTAKPQERTNERVGPFYNFFLPDPRQIELGQHVSEDVSFCRRWMRDCGGEVWAWADAPIFHIGDFGFGGSYSDYVRCINKVAAKLRRRHG